MAAHVLVASSEVSESIWISFHFYICLFMFTYRICVSTQKHFFKPVSSTAKFKHKSGSAAGSLVTADSISQTAQPPSLNSASTQKPL